MKVQGLILVLLVPWFAHAAPQYYGSRVARLELSGVESQADLQVLPLHTGDSITPENLRASIQALHDTGHYSYIEIDAAPAGEGTTNLTFRVRPYFFFSTFRLEPENLLERSLSGYFRLPFGEKFTSSAVERIVQDTTELLKTAGYFEATITPRYDFDETTHLAFVTLQAVPGPQAKLGNIRIEAAVETFSQKELLDALGLESGDRFSSAGLDKGIASIRAKFIKLGFLNTRVTDGRTYVPLTRTVDLNLTIQPGQFTLVQTRGLDVSKKKLQEMVPVFEEGTIDQELVEEGRVQIGRYVQQEGYFEASVTAEIIEAPLDNAVQINYAITLGLRHEISAVRIEGNQHFTVDEIHRQMKVRKGVPLSRGVFSSEMLDEDVRTIEAMYRNAGFEGTTVRGGCSEVNHVIEVMIQIDEGKQRRVEFLAILGNYGITDLAVRSAVRLKEGDTYRPAAVDEARAALTQLYFSKGYADVRVDPVIERVESNDGMRLTFRITEGESYQIGRILVAGNTLTREKIIHRNSNLYPNTPYNPEAILEGQQRLYATGLFSRVEVVTLAEGRPGVRDLLIQVEDAQPILLTYGVGYQEFERGRVTVDLSHNNLFGLDRSISFRGRYSLRERLFQTTYREPKLFNHDLDGFGSFFVEYTERPFFTANRIDFSLQILKRFSPQQNLLITTGYQTVNLGDIRVNPQAEKLPDERGIFQIARVGTSWIQDRRNDPLNPSSGSFNTTTLQVASRALGSELNFTSLYNLYSVYTPVPYGVFATAVRLGWNHPFGRTGKLPPTERYFAGGSTTLRGFGLDEARPEGGNVLTIGNFEYRVPLRSLPIAGIGGAVFYDTGNVFPAIADVHLKDFTHTVGIGLRYQTPLGPVRIDFGLNLNPRINQDGQREERLKVFFTLGNPF